MFFINSCFSDIKSRGSSPLKNAKTNKTRRPKADKIALSVDCVICLLFISIIVFGILAYHSNFSLGILNHLSKINIYVLTAIPAGCAVGVVIADASKIFYRSCFSQQQFLFKTPAVGDVDLKNSLGGSNLQLEKRVKTSNFDEESQEKTQESPSAEKREDEAMDQGSIHNASMPLSQGFLGTDILHSDQNKIPHASFKLSTRHILKKKLKEKIEKSSDSEKENEIDDITAETEEITLCTSNRNSQKKYPELEESKKFGNKTANLMILQMLFKDAEDVSIPAFWGIEDAVIKNYLDDYFPKLNSLWKDVSNKIEEGLSIESLKDPLEVIQQGIQKAFDLPEADHLFSEAFSVIGTTDPWMVRSTGREDGLELANPGGNESIANVHPISKEIRSAIGKVISSYFSVKSLGQRQAAGDDIAAEPFMPILLQKMVSSKKEKGSIPVSGVMYSSEAELLTSGVVQISSAFGHAEGVVTGTAASDTYFVDGQFIHGTINIKTTRQSPAKSGKLKTIYNSSSLKKTSSLTKDQLISLAQIARKIEVYYGRPMDIEWSYNPDEQQFYLFQARPISLKPQVHISYISPNKFARLKNIQRVEVIVSGGGEVKVLKRSNILITESAPAALKTFLSTHSQKLQAIFISKPTALNSHEAGFFRERGVPLIKLSHEQMQGMRSLSAHETLLLDTQASILGSVPPGDSKKDFIVQGLRMHLAPKTVSSIPEVQCSEDTYEKFYKELVSLAKKTLLIKTKGFGFNQIDQLLNAFEETLDPKKRAYFLLTLLTTVRTQFINIPIAQRESLFQKIFYNSFYMWNIFQFFPKDKLKKKLAINWLRACLLHFPQSNTVDSDSLVSILGEVKERKVLGINPPADTIHDFADIFLRSSKFILKKSRRKDWKQFIHGLNEEQLQQLAQIFQMFGSDLIEGWLNAKFPLVWDRVNKHSKNKSASCCLDFLYEESMDKECQEAVSILKKAHLLQERFNQLASEFALPQKFDTVFVKLQAELYLDAIECIKRIPLAQGYAAALLAHAFTKLLDTYDNCIKNLTTSAHYPTAQLKAQKFVKMLEGYHELTQLLLNKGILRGNASLIKQAKVLAPFLQQVFVRLKKKAEADPERALLPTQEFSVAAASLGSCFHAPQRVSPLSLEDFFTQLHQSMLTAVQVVENRQGVSMDQLPKKMFEICDKLMNSLDLKCDYDSTSLILQYIECAYPKIKAYFNVPLNNHSAQLCLEGKLEKGRLESIELHISFFCPENSLGLIGRSEYLRTRALLSFYHENPMPAASSCKMDRSVGPAVHLTWTIASKEIDYKHFLDTMVFHLQAMIDFLQVGPLGTKIESDFYENPKLIQENLWIADEVLERDFPPKLEEHQFRFVQIVLQTVLQHKDEAAISLILRRFYKMFRARPEVPEWAEIFHMLCKEKNIWENFDLFKQFTCLLYYMHPQGKIFASELKRVVVTPSEQVKDAIRESVSRFTDDQRKYLQHEVFWPLYFGKT